MMNFDYNLNRVTMFIFLHNRDRAPRRPVSIVLSDFRIISDMRKY